MVTPFHRHASKPRHRLTTNLGFILSTMTASDIVHLSSLVKIPEKEVENRGKSHPE
jgi:hypothetical protein